MEQVNRPHSPEGAAETVMGGERISSKYGTLDLRKRKINGGGSKLMYIHIYTLEKMYIINKRHKLAKC